jgi:hypothetical protein
MWQFGLHGINDFLGGVLLPVFIAYLVYKEFTGG